MNEWMNEIPDGGNTYLYIHVYLLEEEEWKYG
jgi:hypothetical protein